MNFKQNGYEVIRKVISEDLLLLLQTEVDLVSKIAFSNEETKLKLKSQLYPNSYDFYSLLCFESLCINLNQKVSDIVGLKLFPTYSYCRIYNENSELFIHKDRQSCEISVTLCVDTTDPWDFHIIDKNKQHKILKLYPGDMCVYMGSDLSHWREKYHGKKQIQCFMHYVNSEGKYKDYKYDKRQIMGAPRSVDDSKFSTSKISYI